MNENKQEKYPVEYVQTLRGGTAHVILFSDGKKYVVKWHGTKKGRDKEVVNEYLIGKLASLFSLPVIPFEVVYIPDEFIQSTNKLNSKKGNYRSGYHYACLYIEDCLVFEDVRKSLPSRKEVENGDMLASILVFDQWVNNTDRGTMNVILEKREGDNYFVHMIDHGRCFPGRYKWSAKTLDEQPVYNYHWPFYKWVLSLLENEQELINFQVKIEAMPNESIKEVIHTLPKEWNVNKEDKEALYQFLLKQKANIASIVEEIMNYHKSRS